MYVKNNLKWLMGELTPSDLHKATGVPQPTIFRITTGESVDPKTASLQPLADYFGVTVADLRDRDLTQGAAERAAPAGLGSGQPTNSTALNAEQRRWLALLEHLGDRDIDEFMTMIQERQQKNLQLVEDLKKRSRQGRRTENPMEAPVEHESTGKKQSLQSS